MEMRMNGLVLTGRLVGDPKTLQTGTYFRLRADDNQPPFPCVCDGLTAKNLVANCHDGDEVSLEGWLEWRKFKNGDMLIILARFISYGRKARTLV